MPESASHLPDYSVFAIKEDGGEQSPGYISASSIEEIKLDRELKESDRKVLDSVFMGSVAVEAVVAGLERNEVLIESGGANSLEILGIDAEVRAAYIAGLEASKEANLPAGDISHEIQSELRSIDWGEFTLDPGRKEISLVPELNYKPNQLQTRLVELVKEPFKGNPIFEAGGISSYMEAAFLPQLEAIERIKDATDRIEMLTSFYKDLNTLVNFIDWVSGSAEPGKLRLLASNLEEDVTSLETAHNNGLNRGRRFDILDQDGVFSRTVNKLVSSAGSYRESKLKLDSMIVNSQLEPETVSEQQLKWDIGDAKSRFDSSKDYGDVQKVEQALRDSAYIHELIGGNDKVLALQYLEGVANGSDIYSGFWDDIGNLLGVKPLPAAKQEKIGDFDKPVGLSKSAAEIAKVLEIPNFNWEEMEDTGKKELIDYLHTKIPSADKLGDRMSDGVKSAKTPSMKMDEEMKRLFSADESGKISSRDYAVYIVIQTMRGKFDWSRSEKDEVSQAVGQHRYAALLMMDYSPREIRNKAFLPQKDNE